MSLYLEISAYSQIIYLTFNISQALSLNHSSSQSLFPPPADIFVVVHSQEVPLLHLIYCKSKGKI
jgi:hypothetical protein